jgi:hypothetical protein
VAFFVRQFEGHYDPGQTDRGATASPGIIAGGSKVNWCCNWVWACDLAPLQVMHWAGARKFSQWPQV